MAQRVVVAAPNPAWAAAFRAEAEALRGALGANALAVHHIGSTAVPGLDAKPIIDIMPVVRDLSAADAATPALRALGYEALGEFGIPGRRYLRKGGDVRTHQVHLFQAGDERNWARHLAFRDYLRAHPAVREAYAALKRRLAARFPDDIAGYCAGKDAFVREVEARALAWYDSAWERLYLAARLAQRPRRLSRHVEVGAVGAAVLSGSGKVYAGASIDAACSWGMCAERAAVAALLADGEDAVSRVAAVAPDGAVLPPCGVCRECLAQLAPAGGDVAVLTGLEPHAEARLRDLLPDWWGRR